MPAETHQLGEEIDLDVVLDLVTAIVGVDVDAAGTSLTELELDDDVSILHLWSAVVEELGERSVGELELDEQPPATLGELATLFHDTLVR